MIYTINTRFGIINLDQFTSHSVKMIQYKRCKCPDSQCMISPVKITIAIEAISLSIDFLKHVVCPLIAVRTVEILDIAIFSGMPYTLRQVTFVIECVSNTSTCAISESIFPGFCQVIDRTEIVPDIINQIPAILQFTGDSIRVTACGFVVELTGKLGLACTDAIFTEVIVVTFNYLYAGQLYTVGIAAVVNPAFKNNTVFIGLAVGVLTVEQFTAFTLENTVVDDEGMTGCRFDGPPYDR